ncbi:unnamed protein product, partial [Mesorhabditis belari]|uniref:Uncharacterized protein n=1 Tax=Mesorhabditis belari TaxID=2138241 RepID=A0AAF3FE44_9BILA
MIHIKKFTGSIVAVLLIEVIYAQNSAYMEALQPSIDPYKPLFIASNSQPTEMKQNIIIRIDGQGGGGRPQTGPKSNPGPGPNLAPGLGRSPSSDAALPEAAQMRLPIVLARREVTPSKYSSKHIYSMPVQRPSGLDQSGILGVDSKLCISKIANPSSGCDLRQLTVSSDGTRLMTGNGKVGWVATTDGACGAGVKVREYYSAERDDYLYYCNGDGCQVYPDAANYRSTGRTFYTWRCQFDKLLLVVTRQRDKQTSSMTEMYRLPPYFPEDARKSVKPNQIIYALPSYHSQNGSTTNADSEFHPFDPVKHIEKDQLALIEKLRKFGSTLDEYINDFSKSKTTPSQSKEGDQNKKINKDAKKEARKENKAKAVEASKDGPIVNEKKTPKASSSGLSDNWIVKEEKDSTETGQSLTVNMPQSLATFPTNETGPVSLSVTTDDHKWVEVMAKIGEERGVLFVGAVRNNAKNPKTTVSVSGQNAVTLSSSNGHGKVTGRVSVWKALGAILGLSSFSSTAALHSAHSHQWLYKADAVLSNSYFKDTLMRESSQFLSSRDSLGGHNSICIADVVVYSLVASIANPPSNVQVWAKRIKTVVG